MVSKKTTEENSLQAFCHAALAGKKTIVIGLNKDLIINLWNATAEKYFGLTATESLNQPYTLLSQYLELKPLTKALQKKIPLSENISTKIIHPADTSKNLVWSLQKIVDQKKAHLGFLLTGEEIEYTAAKEDKFLNASVAELINEIPGSVYFKDLEGKYLWCNDFMVKMAGENSVINIIGKDDYQLCWKDIASEFTKNDKEVIASGKSRIVEEPMELADGTNSVFLTYKSPLYDKTGNIIGVVGNSLDISDQKAVLEKIKQTSTKQEEVLYYLTKFANNLPGSLYFKDVNSKYLWVNDYVVKMAGVNSVLDIVGKDDYQFCWKDLAKPWIENDQEVMRSKRSIVAEETILLADGSYQSMLSNKTPVFDENGEVIGVMGNSLDITTQKAVEDTLRMAEEKDEGANRAKTQFITNMSHDIRTPLTGLIGMARIIKKEVSSAKAKEATDYLIESANILLDLLNGVLEFSKLESGELPIYDFKFSVKEVIDNITTLIMPSIQEKNLRLIIDYDKKLPNFLIGDKIRIHRILLNLVGNAIKFTQEGSIQISLHLAKKSGKDIVLKMEIKDTGIGIPQDKQQIIFSKFNRLNPTYAGIYKGYGLGLSVVKQFIAELEGEIEVKSEEGKGSTFTCLIPLRQTLLDEEKISTKEMPPESVVERAIFELEAKDHQTVLQNQNNSSQKFKERNDMQKIKKKHQILLVEDNKFAQMGAKNELDGLNCDTDIAGTGEEALELFKKNEYDLILMDIGLPKKNGIEATLEIRELEKNKNTRVPIVALTAHADQYDAQQCIDAGMDDILDKPLTEEKAQRILKEYIRTEKTPQEDTQFISTLDKSMKVIDLEWSGEALGYGPGEAKIMLGVFMENLPATKQEIEKAYKKSDWEKFKFYIEKLYEGTLYCSVPRVKEATLQLVEAFRKKDTQQVTHLYQQLLKEIEKLMSEFTQLT